VAVYPGSFDPITLGHMDILERATKLFDRVIVGIGSHPAKRGWFPVEERREMVAASAASLATAANVGRIDVEAFDGLVVDFCKRRGASVIVRGLRATGDFEPEFQMGLANRDLAPEIETVFLIPRADRMYVSSSLVREIAGHGGNYRQYVTGPVADAVSRRLAGAGGHEL
jgi:pantetheine-phosphate adenylyltransferase